MVEQAPGESVDEQNEDRVTSNYRMLVQEKQDTHTKKKWSSTLYTACTCLVIAILAAGTVFVRDYDKMQQLESQVHQLAVSVLRQDTETIAVEQVKGDVYPTETESGTIQNFPMQSTETSEETILNTEESAIIETTSVQETTTEKETETEEETTIETTTAETSGIQSISGQAGYYYTVKKGETLTSICIAVYQSDHMVSAIKEANGIEDGDKIYPGQEIYLP